MATLRMAVDRQRDRTVVVHLAGSAGVDSTEMLEQFLIELAVARPDVVVVDLSGLSFISSLSMGLLLAFRLKGG